MQDQTRSVVAGLVADLIDAFPRSPIGASTPKLYVRELSDIPPAHLERAVRHLIRTSTEPWLPQIGEVRRVVAEQQLGLPDEQEALAQVDRRIEWARGPEGPGAPDVHPAVSEALAAAGGYAALRNADNPGAARGSFLRHYRAIRGRAIAGAQTGAALEVGPRLAALG
jgi:hypothetical protein